MTRVTFGTKEHRRDQRRPVPIEGRIGGVKVELVDLSLTGVGGGTVSLAGTSGMSLQEGESTSLEFTGPDGQTITLPVTIQRFDDGASGFGAVFSQLSGQDFDAIEKLMFPRRGKARE